MKRLISIVLGLMLVASLFSCATPTAIQPTPTPTVDLVEPGENVGGILLVGGGQEEAKLFTDYCDPGAEPGEVSVRKCNVPAVERLGLGWGGGDTTLEKLNQWWQQTTWELYLDGQPLDLPAFGTADFDTPYAGIEKFRLWRVDLGNPTPGLHTLRYVIKSENPDYRNDITWEITVGNSTTLSTTYPVLSSTPDKGQQPHTFQGKLNYLLYVPQDYGKDSQEKWPVILFLHGIGVRTDNLDLVKTEGLPKTLASKTDFPFIVISPQLVGGTERDYWSQPAVVELLFGLLDEVQAKLSIDPDRIYLTGLSLGGQGAWEIGLKNPEKFAALAPIAGFWRGPTTPENICDLKNKPIWAFHGTKDDIVPFDDEKGLVDALKACGGNVQFTVYKDAGHEIWDQAYATPELYTWMLEQVLK